MKRIKKVIGIVAIVALTMSMSSCATVFGGHVSEYQRTKPLPGEPQRQIRVAALVADVVLFLPGTIVDFATGAIYKPIK